MSKETKDARLEEAIDAALARAVVRHPRRKLWIAPIVALALAAAAVLFWPPRGNDAFDVLPDTTFLLVHGEGVDALLESLATWRLWQEESVLSRMTRGISKYQVAALARRTGASTEVATELLEQIDSFDLAWIGFDAAGPQTVLIVKLGSLETLDAILQEDPPPHLQAQPPVGEVPVWRAGPGGPGVEGVHVALVRDRRLLAIASGRSALTRVLNMAAGGEGGRLSDSPLHGALASSAWAGESLVFALPSAAGADTARAVAWLAERLPSAAVAPILRPLLQVGGLAVRGARPASVLASTQGGLGSGEARMRVVGSEDFAARYGTPTLRPVDRNVFRLVPKHANFVAALSTRPAAADPRQAVRFLQALLRDLTGEPIDLGALLPHLGIDPARLAGVLGDTVALYSTASLGNREFSYYGGAAILAVTDEVGARRIVEGIWTSPRMIRTLGGPAKQKRAIWSRYTYMSVQLDERRSVYYAFVDGLLVVTAAERVLRDAMDALDKDLSLLRDPNFTETLDAVPEQAGAVVLCDLAAVLSDADLGRARSRQLWPVWTALALQPVEGSVEIRAFGLRPLIGMIVDSVAAEAGEEKEPHGKPPRAPFDFLLLPEKIRSR